MRSMYKDMSAIRDGKVFSDEIPLMKAIKDKIGFKAMVFVYRILGLTVGPIAFMFGILFWAPLGVIIGLLWIIDKLREFFDWAAEWLGILGLLGFDVCRAFGCVLIYPVVDKTPEKIEKEKYEI